MKQDIDHRPLRIGLLSYRSHPYCGGQGVYIRNLSHALCRLGHHVDVISGPPYPQLDNGARLRPLPSLDLYNPDDLFRMPRMKELCDPVNLIEWMGVSTMGFPEPLTFGLRAKRYVRSQAQPYDVLHDNQSLSYGIWSLARQIPTVATIHHAITVDRKLAIKAEHNALMKAKQWRWYSFISMQKRVAPTLKRIITVSRCAREDIIKEFGLPASRFDIIPNGIDTEQFYPIPEIQRQPDRLMVTTSADVPLKGLRYLLQAVALLAPKRPRLKLVVVGTPKKNSPIRRLINQLGIEDRVQFTGVLDHDEFVRQYARASLAVVPSLYEGFGLPAGEAMACRVPVISTTGGALPEVVGDAGMLVPPGNHQALADAISVMCDNPQRADTLGEAGYRRVMQHFTWDVAARKTETVYRQVIRDYR